MRVFLMLVYRSFIGAHMINANNTICQSPEINICAANIACFYDVSSQTFLLLISLLSASSQLILDQVSSVG